MTIIAALQDRSLFGALPCFQNLATWRAWLVFLSAVYGLPLDRDGERLFCQHTGRVRYNPPAGGWREVVGIVGRQSGKSRIAATLAAYEAVTATAEADRTETFALLIAQDQRAALRSLLSYVRSPFEHVPVLARSVQDARAESVTLANGCVLAAYPCRPAAVRGLRARVAIADELAFYRSSEGFPTDTEMLRAVRPCLATTGGKLVILSSPYAQAGALYDLHRKHYGREDAAVLVWQASAPAMNPTLPADYLARMAEDDPEAYRSEVLGEFRAGVSAFLDPEAVAACVADGVRERVPEPGRSYMAFCDPSGGRRDAFALAIAHAEGERGVLDVLRSWRPPFNPAGVVAEAADLLRRYHVAEVRGDRYAGEFVAEQFRAHQVDYQASVQDRSALYLELLPLVNAGRVVLLDSPDLLRELRGLERRRGASGRDKVDHGPGGHDDAANAAAGALGLVAREADGNGYRLLFGAEWQARETATPEPVEVEDAAPVEDEPPSEDRGLFAGLRRLPVMLRARSERRAVEAEQAQERRAAAHRRAVAESRTRALLAAQKRREDAQEQAARERRDWAAAALDAHCRKYRAWFPPSHDY